MEWRDQGLVLGTRRFGETGCVLEAMTRAHGRHSGLVHGGRSRRKTPLLQPGNTLSLHWRARLDENLGAYTIEPGISRAGRAMRSEIGLLIIGTVCEHLRLTAERDPHAALYDAACIVLDAIDDALSATALLVRFEIAFLDEIGMGLDLTRCAVTGEAGGNTVLSHVSPKSGRAVSAAEAAPYAEKLLPLPGFLNDARAPVAARDVADGLRLTSHFLDHRLYAANGIAEPYARRRLVMKIGREGLEI